MGIPAAIHSGRNPLYKIDPNDLGTVTPEPADILGGALVRMRSVGFEEPCSQVIFEDFFPGHEYRWTTFIDQIDYCISGKAEITYRESPALDTEVTVQVEAPCIYLLARGCIPSRKVIGDEVFCHLSFDLPNPMFPAAQAKSVSAQSAAAD